MPVSRKLSALFSVIFFFSPLLSLAQQNPAAKPAQKSHSKEPSKSEPASPLDAVIDALFSAHTFQQTAISPNGKKVAWVENLLGKNGVPDGNTAIYLTGLQSTEGPARISASTGKKGVATKNGLAVVPTYVPRVEGSVAWSADSTKIAFLSDAVKPGQPQLYIYDLSRNGEFRRLTNVKGLLASPAWSPDGKSIAVLFTENAIRAAGPLVAEAPETGEIKDSYFEQRLAIVDVASGELRQISPADMYVYEYAWSPDSSRFALIAAPGNGDDNWYIAQLYTLDAGPLGVMKSIYKPPLQIANPVWSPDGKQIAFIAGLMSDEPSVGGDIYAISSVGGSAKNLTPEMKASASWLAWPSPEKIVFGEFLGGDAAVSTLDPATSSIAPIFQDEGQLTAGAWGTGVSLADDGVTAAAIRSAFGTPPEVWAGEIGHWKQLTHRNDNVQPAWGDAKSIHWKSDGYDVQGWLIYPKGFDPSKKYPMVVSVHGGPGYAQQSNWPDSWDFEMALPGSGYFLFYPNPRGSFGQGEAFTAANVKDFGYGDFRDILAGVDEALRSAPIDPNRLGLTGWSYGGYMTMWGVTQTNRFRAAMAGAGIADWLSYYGENKIDQWMIPFFGKSVYDDPEVYAKSSPINFVKNVKTPTLVLVGDSDGEAPAPQSYEFWHALKTLGVETQLVVYEHEGHMFENPEHKRDLIRRTVAWFDAHLR